MNLNESDKNLIEKLKKISMNHDFITGTMSIAKRKQDRDDILRFINKAEENREKLTQDDILALAIALKGRKLDGEK